jgi:hypothetical protein
MPSRGRSTSRSVAIASGLLVLGLLIAPGAQAATWGSPSTLADAAFARADGVVSLGGTVAIALHEVGDDPTSIHTRRTINGGLSWAPPVLVASGTDGFGSIAGRDSAVDVVWRHGDGRLRYRRSTDGGQSYEPSIVLSKAGTFAWRPEVARGAGGLVAVLWETSGTGRIRVRVSTDGGLSFGAARLIATEGEENDTDLAIANGAIVAAYGLTGNRVRIRRSVDQGVTWQPPVAITGNAGFGDLSLAAAGKEVVIGFTGSNPTAGEFSQVRYRRSTDRGASWAKVRPLAPADMTTSNPDLSVKGGIIRAVFERCTTEFDICVNARILYRQSADGRTWTAPERVSPASIGEGIDGAVTYAGAIVVVYTGWDVDKVFARRGT